MHLYWKLDTHMPRASLVSRIVSAPAKRREKNKRHGVQSRKYVPPQNYSPSLCVYLSPTLPPLSSSPPLLLPSPPPPLPSFSPRLRAPVGNMTVREQQLEGQLRYVNNRVITNSEEVSFYQGSTRERQTIRDTFQQLVSRLERALKRPSHECIYTYRIGISYLSCNEQKLHNWAA